MIKLAVAAILVAASAPAMAKTIALGALTNEDPVTFGNVLSKKNPSDIVTFSFLGTSNSDLGANLGKVAFSVKNITYNFSSLSATFYKGTYGSGSSTLLGTIGGDSQSHNFLNLAYGDYYALITGTPTGTGGGSYRLTLLSSAAPAPGPAGYLGTPNNPGAIRPKMIHCA